MTDLVTYALQIRLQTVMTALQNLHYAVDNHVDHRILDPEDREALVYAMGIALAALDVALGASHEIPDAITNAWVDRQMVRDAPAVLKEAAQ
jgi:hypothetical protein